MVHGANDTMRSAADTLRGAVDILRSAAGTMCGVADMMGVQPTQCMLQLT